MIYLLHITACSIFCQAEAVPIGERYMTALYFAVTVGALLLLTLP